MLEIVDPFYSILNFPYCYFLFGLYIRRSVECVLCWYEILCRVLLPLRTHASMCCFKIWYFFNPNIVCIKGEEYDEVKGALGNKIRLKSWWITFNHFQGLASKRGVGRIMHKSDNYSLVKREKKTVENYSSQLKW